MARFPSLATFHKDKKKMVQNPIFTPQKSAKSRHVCHLRLGQAEAAGQLLPLGAYHVMVLLEGPLQAQQLRRREGGSDPLGLPGERAVEEQAVLGRVVTYRAGTTHTRTAITAHSSLADGTPLRLRVA